MHGLQQALNKAINRDELNKAMFNGKGQTMVLNHFHQNREGWNPEWERQFPQMYGYDPAAARKLLADAGQSNLKTSIMLGTAAGVPNAPGWVAIGVARRARRSRATSPPAPSTPNASRRSINSQKVPSYPKTRKKQTTSS